ncbi:MAG: glycerophosphodiester phosphodiesterase [Candidatus Omnitrophica bacterium]|nr:glycerophosphodiester phosphodiesterase [Candidatus Omnitrophota bacterium]
MEDIIVVGHRGFSGKYPENTILSFKKAVELGVDFIELDVWETKDGKIIVIHDDRLDRTTNGTGLIKDMTYKEIKKYDAGVKFGFPGERVPLLDDVFEEIGDKVKILIEIKGCDINKLIKLIKKYKMEEKVIVGSFNFEYLKKIRKKIPEIPSALISGFVPYDYLKECIKLGIRKLDIEFHHLDKEIVKNLISMGFLVNTWTPNSEEDLRKVISYGVQFITTDRPDLLIKIKKEEL